MSLQFIPLSYYAGSGLVNFLTAFAISLIVFSSHSKSKTNKIFIAFSCSVAYWSFLYFIWIVTKSKEWAEFYLRTCMIGVLFMPSLFIHFVTLFLKFEINRKFKIINYALSFLFTLTIYTPFYAKDIDKHLVFPYWLHPGPIFHLALIHFGTIVLYSFHLMWKSIAKEKGGFRNQILYVFIGTAIGYISGVTNFFCWYRINIPPFLNIFISVYVIMVAIAIVKYRLMDIKITLTRTGIFIAVYTIVLGLPFVAGGCLKGWLSAIFGMHWWTLPLSLMAVLATLGPFLYIFLERKAEEQLLKEQKNYQRTLRQASMGMTRIRDLRRLLELIAHIVTKSVGIAYVGIYLHNKESGDYVLQVSRDKGRESILKLGCDNSLIAWITLKHQPLIYEEVKRLMEETGSAAYKSLEENMRLLTAAVVIPSFLEDRFMGFIVLGEKISGQIYTADDLNVFQVLANQAALAIENAQFYDQTKQMHVQIAQAEKMATIGTMADGLSHQINNRFYALSLIAEDTIDNIKCTDTSQCSAEIKEMIEEINYALGRIKQNVLQGGQVVKGILKYTRKGEEKFEPVTLDQIIDGTLEMVQYKIKLSEIDIIRNYDSNLLPKIKANLIQMQESWFNLIDNAYDATVERKTKSEEEGYRGKIEFSALVKEEGIIEIKITDNGMGVKQENLKKLFTPFFTTKVSSRQGTGLGLYVIKRIIEENHHGKVRIESEHGKGTTFFIELYIWQGEQDGMKDETKR